MNTFFSKSILSAAALAGLAGAFLFAASPAEAKKSQCQVKYSGCNSRCFAKHDDPFPCIQRTCDRQYDNCAAAEGGGGGKGGKGGRGGLIAPMKQPGPVVSGPQTPRDPSKTGPFVPGGMKPKDNGGIASGGMQPKNGGIVPGRPMRTSSQGKR